MTRTEAIAIIKKHIDRASDDTLAAAAERLEAADGQRLSGEAVADAISNECSLSRPLTPRELELIEQSKEDFRLGRAVTLDEARMVLDDRLAKHGVPRSR